MSNCDQSCRRHRHHDRCDRHRRRRCNECRPFGIDCEVWDYIIVGAGAAGSVLAERLSADRRTSVLLLEAGQNSDHNPIIVAPNADVQQYFPQFFWQGRSLPEPLANNRTFQWTNGRLQGGGTSVYGMIYVRGTEERFDEWPAAGAGPTWNGPVVMQTYKEMERFNNNDAPPVSDPQNHGTQGRLQVRVGLSDSNSLPAFRRALTASNYPGTDRLIDDYNDPATPIGVFDNWQYYQFPDQTRGSSSRDYLGPDVIDAEGNGVNGRRLRVDTQTTAGRFIWSEREENTVIGVYAVRRSVPVQYLARRRVIVSAGIKSPQLLEINGIGPRPVLEAAGVDVRVDLPGVGRNVRNGPFILAALFIAPQGTTKNSQPGSFNVGGAFLPDPREGADPNIRKLEVNGAVSDDIIPGLRVAYILLQPLRPTSTGFAEIQDADVNKVELADVGLLTTENDLETLRLTFQRLIAPMSTSLQGEGYIQISPAPGTFEDPALLTEYIKNNVGNTHHYQCFNKMGPADEGGVVNEWGEVHGVRNLSVIDDSIAPLATDGNTAGTAMMLAYRISKHLRGEI